MRGFPFVAAGLLLAAACWYGRQWSPVLAPGSAVFGLAAAFMAFFFRDPRRRAPALPGAVVSAADGRVVSVEQLAHDDYLDGPATRISVFLSVFNVHVNRVPHEGEVDFVDRRTGRYRVAYAEQASEDNEQSVIGIRCGDQRLVVKQIVGILARRIACRLVPGQQVSRGERFGLIRFGSRVDLILPESDPDRGLGGRPGAGRRNRHGSPGVINRGLIPNLFTVGNLFCGFLALRYIVDGNYVPAAWLIVLASALDNMDGRLARYMGRDSRFGIEFDSLADVCTFGLVPAFMLYHSLVPTGWGAALASVFLLCGALRLARFNVMSQDERQGRVLHRHADPRRRHRPEPVHRLHRPLLGDGPRRPPRRAPDPVPVDADGQPRRVRLHARLPVRRAAESAASRSFFVAAVALVVHPATSKDFFFPIALIYLLSGLYRWVAGLFSDEVTQHA